MPEENTDHATAQNPTSDETVQNTGATPQDSGAAHANAAVETEAQQPKTPTAEKTFTQKQVDALFSKRLDAAVKAKLKQLVGDEEGNVPDVKQLQQQLTEYQQKARNYETKEEIIGVLREAKINPDNHPAITELALGKIEYDQDGNILNLKEAVEGVKALAPALFAAKPTTNINGNAGRNQAQSLDWNAEIRRAAGFAG